MLANAVPIGVRLTPPAGSGSHEHKAAPAMRGSDELRGPNSIRDDDGASTRKYEEGLPSPVFGRVFASWTWCWTRALGGSSKIERPKVRHRMCQHVSHMLNLPGKAFHRLAFCIAYRGPWPKTGLLSLYLEDLLKGFRAV